MQYTPQCNLDLLKQHYSDKTEVITSDLSSILMSPFQLAMDIAAAISDSLLHAVFDLICQPVIKKHAGSTYEYWIDYDSVGRVSYIKAMKIFSLLKPELQKIQNCHLLIAISQSALCDDNTALVKYIQTFLPEITIHLCSEEVLTNLSCFESVEQSDFLQKSEKLAAPSQQQSLQAVTTFPAYIFAAYISKDIEDDSPVLGLLDADQDAEVIMNYAWIATHLDALGLAKNIFEQAYALSKDDANKVNYLLCLQAVRVGQQRYQDVMQEDYPPVLLNEKTKDALWYSKAYAGVLSRDYDMAGKYFDVLSVDESLTPSSIESLYRLNIYALYLFHQKYKDKALLLENIILSKIDDFEDKNTTFIKYINSLNLARVYRANKDFDASLRYCDMAYEAIRGLKTESDHVYFNLNYAALYEGNNDLNKAFYAWLRAALHWQSMTCPLSLAWRPQAMLLGKAFEFSQPVDPNKINQIFIDKLQNLSKKIDLQVKASVEKHPVFCRLYRHNVDLAEASYIGNAEVSYLLLSQPVERLYFPHQQGELAVLLTAILEKLTSVAIPHEATIIIDSNEGFGISLTETELKARCFALGISHYQYAGKLKQVDESFGRTLAVTLSPAIYQLNDEEGMFLASFKRYMDDVELSKEEYEVASHLSETGAMPFAALQDVAKPSVIKKLYDKKIICYVNGVHH